MHSGSHSFTTLFAFLFQTPSLIYQRFFSELCPNWKYHLLRMVANKALNLIWKSKQSKCKKSDISECIELCKIRTKTKGRKKRKRRINNIGKENSYKIFSRKPWFINNKSFYLCSQLPRTRVCVCLSYGNATCTVTYALFSTNNACVYSVHTQYTLLWCCPIHELWCFIYFLYVIIFMLLDVQFFPCTQSIRW